MRKIFFLIFIVFLLNGCAESFSLLSSTAVGASNGKIVHTSLNSAASYTIKKKTGKTPIGHAITYVEKSKPKKTKEPCSTFTKKTNSEMCEIVKNQITLTKTKINNNKNQNKSLKDLTSSTQFKIDQKSKIKYLD